MKKLVYITGALFAILQILGGLFKILHWPGANILLLLSAATALVFIPALARYLYLKTS